MLSRRGAAVVESGKRNVMWEVMRNSFDEGTNKSGYVNLGVAENTLMQDELIRQLVKTFEPPSSAFSYGEGPGGSLRLRQAIAAFLNRFFSPVITVQAEHITVSNGVTSSIERCAFEIGNRGDGFLLGRPFYNSFPTELGERAGVDTIPVSFGHMDPFGTESAVRYEEELLKARRRGQNVRALLLCSPHNPLGRCYPRETIIELMKMCQRHSIHLIVDEIYALSSYVNAGCPHAEPFTSVLAIETKGIIDPALVHVLWGLSKDFGANGLRIGCVVSQRNAKLVAALDAHAPHSYPSAFSASSLLEDHGFVEKYALENRARLTENFRFVTSFLEEHGYNYYRGSNAGFFVWVDLGQALLRRCQGTNTTTRRQRSRVGGRTANHGKTANSQLADAPGLTQRVMDRLMAEKVFLARGDAFGSESPGWFRIVFAQKRQLLCEGLRRIVAAIES